MDPSEDVTMGEEMIALHRREPFTPYTIVMASGSRYEVRENDNVSVVLSVVVVVPGKGGQHLLRLTQVSEVSVEEMPQ